MQSVENECKHLAIPIYLIDRLLFDVEVSNLYVSWLHVTGIYVSRWNYTRKNYWTSPGFVEGI